MFKDLNLSMCEPKELVTERHCSPSRDNQGQQVHLHTEILYSPSHGNCVNFREVRELKHKRVSTAEPSMPKNTGTHHCPESIFT